VPTVFSCGGPVKLVEGGVESLRTGGEDGIAAGGAITAGSGEGSRVKKEGLAYPVIHRQMGVTVNNTIRRGKKVPHPLLNIVPVAGTVAEADTVTINIDQLVCGKSPVG